MPAIIAPAWPRDPNFPSVLQEIVLPSCWHRLDPLSSFPLHVGEICKLLVRATALAIAVVTAAIEIAHRPSPRASFFQQRQARGSPLTSLPLHSLDFASSSYSLRLVHSSFSLAHWTIVPAPPSSSCQSPWWTSSSPTTIWTIAAVHSTSTTRSPQDRRRKDNLAMPAKVMKCSRAPSSMIPYSQLLLVRGRPTLTGAVGLTLNLRRTCNHNNDAPKLSARSRAIWWCQRLCLIWPAAANRTSPAVDLINWLPFCFNFGVVSYLEPLYGMVERTQWRVPLGLECFFFFSKMVWHVVRGDTLASHFVSRRWLWLLKTDYLPATKTVHAYLQAMLPSHTT